MTLLDDTAALATIGGKDAGYLIRSQDWNGLIESVTAIRDAVLGLQTDVQGINDNLVIVNQSIGELDLRLGTVESDLTALEARVEPLLTEFYRITLQTSRLSYALGEQAEITATVSDLAGNPLDFAQIARPWIDFVSSWGRLRAVSGFETRAGAGDNSLSVRVDNAGVARVRLRSDHTEGFTEDQESQVATAMELAVSSTNMAVAQTFLAAATPSDAGATAAYRLMSTEYERAGSPMRTYLDAYYAVNTPQRALSVLPFPGSGWRDYRGTVLAFVKNDSDPTTPDQARAVSSIQVTFRDWIYHWTFDYIRDVGVLSNDFRARLAGNLSADYLGSLGRVQLDVRNSTAGAGLVQRQKHFNAWDVAVEQLEVAQPPGFLEDLKVNVQSGLHLQQVVDVSEAATGAQTQRAFDAYSAAASKVAGIDSVVGSVRIDVDGMDSNVRTLETSVTSLQTQVDASAVASQTIQAKLGNIEDQVQSIDLLDAETLQSNLQIIGADIGLIRNLIIPGG